MARNVEQIEGKEPLPVIEAKQEEEEAIVKIAERKRNKVNEPGVIV